jgi:hypothetical protein
MKSMIKAVAAAACFSVSLGALAAKPTSITFQSEGKGPDGSEYALYVVKCSDGQEKPLTAWDSRKRWCVGNVSEESCEKKQIRAAKTACK